MKSIVDIFGLLTVLAFIAINGCLFFVGIADYKHEQRGWETQSELSCTAKKYHLIVPGHKLGCVVSPYTYILNEDL
jgi:hypothetical protein